MGRTSLLLALCLFTRTHTLLPWQPSKLATLQFKFPDKKAIGDKYAPKCSFFFLFCTLWRVLCCLIRIRDHKKEPYTSLTSSVHFGHSCGVLISLPTPPIPTPHLADELFYFVNIDGHHSSSLVYFWRRKTAQSALKRLNSPHRELRDAFFFCFLFANGNLFCCAHIKLKSLNKRDVV